MKHSKRIFSFLLILILTASLCAGVASADNKIDYQITNPYASVDWDTWKAYKGATHVHTVRSDGNVEVDDMIENYYALGYQTLALTDHGTVNYGWTSDQSRLALYAYQFFVHGTVDPLTQARYEQITTGVGRAEEVGGMTEIPYGIELNGASATKCHVNSYFADCGHGDLEILATWPESAVKKCQKAGGLCHINHVGEWTDGKDDVGTYDASFVAKFSKLFLNYPACVGMELVNTTDNRTHNDRYLYDETLKVTAAQGKNIFGFCEDDSHDPEDCGNNANYFLMPENTWQNVRTAMETGAFFACSKNAKTAAELGDGFTAQGEFPTVTRIAVDEEKDQISISAKAGKTIKLVADGAVLDTKTIAEGTAIFDLHEYENSIGNYVRFYILGDGGICYLQPFLLKAVSMDAEPVITATVSAASNTATVSCSVSAAPTYDINAQLFVAQYVNGQLQSTQISEIFAVADGCENATFAFPDVSGATYRVFLLEKETAVPLCSAQQASEP